MFTNLEKGFSISKTKLQKLIRFMHLQKETKKTHKLFQEMRKKIKIGLVSFPKLGASQTGETIKGEEGS